MCSFDLFTCIHSHLCSSCCILLCGSILNHYWLIVIHIIAECLPVSCSCSCFLSFHMQIDMLALVLWSSFSSCLRAALEPSKWLQLIFGWVELKRIIRSRRFRGSSSSDQLVCMWFPCTACGVLLCLRFPQRIIRQREQEWMRSLACDVFRIFLIAASSAGFVAFSLALSRVLSVHSWRSRRLHITIDVPLSYACSVCHPRFLGDMLHAAFINKMVQGGNIICPWSMFKTCVLNSFNNNVTEVIQTGWRVLKNRTGPAPDLWPRSMMMQKAFYDGWVDAAARAAGLPPPAAGCLWNEV